MDISLLIKHGLICSALLTIALLIIGLKNPRFMLQDYPKEIIDAVPPKTKQEKKQGILFGIPFLLIFIGYPLYFGWAFSVQHSYWVVFFNVWSIALFANAYDLIILDWLVICAITPKFVVIPGTEGNKGYKNYLFHFIGFLKGVVITFLISLMLSGILMLLFKLP